MESPIGFLMEILMESLNKNFECKFLMYHFTSAHMKEYQNDDSMAKNTKFMLRFMLWGF